MEQPSPDTNEKGKQLIIEGPEFLSHEQNFFDQQPFNLYLGVLESRGIEPTHFYRALSAKAMVRYGDWLERLSRLRLSVREKQRIILTLEEVGKFPLIFDYIRAQKANNLYNSVGELQENITPNSFLPQRPKSYGAWVEKQQSASRREISHGIEEVFSQQTSQTVKDNVPAIKPSTRRWVIMKQAGVIPEKR